MKEHGWPFQLASASFRWYTFRPNPPTAAAAHVQKRVEKLLLHAFFTTHAALAVRAQAQSVPTCRAAVDRRPVLPSPSPATPHLHPRERCLPCSQASAVVRRCDANSTTGLKYHIELTQRRATGELQGVPLVRRPLRAQRTVGSPAPSPAPARPPQQPLSSPFSKPGARFPHCYPAVAERA